MLRLTFFLFAVLLSVAAYAGHSSNGGALSIDNDNVWFLGDQPVEYCVEIDPAFKVSHVAVRKMVRESISDWKRFFNFYGLDEMSFPGTVNGKKLKLALNFVEVSACTQPLSQIRFNFGGMPQEVKDALKYEEGAIGLTTRPDYNHTTYRTGGIVWFRQWTYSVDELRHFVLHEIGHVFGMKHDSVHVMDAMVAERIINHSIPENLLGKIESSVWPYRFDPGNVVDFTESGRNVVEGLVAEPNSLISAFFDLVEFSRGNSHLAGLTTEQNIATRNDGSGVQSFNVALSIHELVTQVQLHFAGKFYLGTEVPNTVRGVRGPVLNTSWDCSRCVSKRETVVHHLDARSSQMTAHGSFTRMGVVYPAVITHDKGMVLKVFIPEKNRWWTTEDYTASYFLRSAN
jgi:hypothetical protein